MLQMTCDVLHGGVISHILEPPDCSLALHGVLARRGQTFVGTESHESREKLW